MPLKGLQLSGHRRPAFWAPMVSLMAFRDSDLALGCQCLQAKLGPGPRPFMHILVQLGALRSVETRDSQKDSEITFCRRCAELVNRIGSRGSLDDLPRIGQPAMHPRPVQSLPAADVLLPLAEGRSRGTWAWSRKQLQSCRFWCNQKPAFLVPAGRVCASARSGIRKHCRHGRSQGHHRRPSRRSVSFSLSCSRVHLGNAGGYVSRCPASIASAKGESRKM